MDILGFFIMVAGIASLCTLAVSLFGAYQHRYISRWWGRALLMCLVVFLGSSALSVVVDGDPDADRSAAADPDATAVPEASVDRRALTDAIEVADATRPRGAAAFELTDFEPDPCVTPRRIKQAWTLAQTLRPRKLRKKSQAFARKVKRCRSKVQAKRAEQDQRPVKAEGLSSVARPDSHCLATLARPTRFYGIDRHLSKLTS